MSNPSWEQGLLRDVATFASGKTPSRSRQREYFYGGTVPWVKTLDLTNADIRQTEERITQRAIRDVKLPVQPAGTVLVAMYGGYQQIGRTGVLRVPAATNQAITAVLPNRMRLNSDYLLHTLNHNVGYWRTIASSSRKDPNITKADVKAFPVALPPLHEQHAIATAINDTDRLMSTVVTLIAKKQAIRHGVMQQLLTGRTRLIGSAEPWAHSTIGSLARVTGGGTPPTRVSAYWGGGVPWFTPAEIKADGSGLVARSERTITQAGLASSAATLLPVDSVLVTSRASIGNCAVAEVPVATNQGFTSMIPKDRRSTWFLYYWVQQNRSEFESRSAGSTFLEISTSKVASIPLEQPSLDEQQAIGEALRGIDTELDALKQRLAKARAIKTGMMQQLMTGRTRLPSKESVA